MEGTKVLRLKWTALLLSVLIFGGCATVESIRPGQGTVFEVTGQSYDDVWENAVRVVSWNFEIIESDKVRGIIQAEGKDNASDSGQLIRVFIVPVRLVTTEGETETIIVEVAGRKKSPFQVSGQDWAAMIIAAMKLELGL